jgi:hypothetical protein
VAWASRHKTSNQVARKSPLLFRCSGSLCIYKKLIAQSFPLGGWNGSFSEAALPQTPPFGCRWGGDRRHLVYGIKSAVNIFFNRTAASQAFMSCCAAGRTGPPTLFALKRQSWRMSISGFQAFKRLHRISRITMIFCANL